ncbi:glutaminase [Phormidium tenue FACHB-886]|nr:glutaminase [Phormidium tenue FACHB-886]
MSRFDSLSESQLANWVDQAKAQASSGRVVDRISLLKAANPNWLALHISTLQQIYSAGETDRVFPLMSVIKPFALLYLLEAFGSHSVFQWVGIEPSDRPFNSLEQLAADQGYPRNPMLNSGAIVLASKLPGHSGTERCAALCTWLNQQAGCRLKLDQEMLAAVRSVGQGTNRAIATFLAKAGYLADPQTALDTYEQICCLSGTVADLALLGQLLVQGYASASSIQPAYRRIVNTLMLTCGLYEASSHYAMQVGLPMKSGISGALLAIVPTEGVIACYSPALDTIGNPVAALALIKHMADHLDLHVF